MRDWRIAFFSGFLLWAERAGKAMPWAARMMPGADLLCPAAQNPGSTESKSGRGGFLPVVSGVGRPFL